MVNSKSSDIPNSLPYHPFRVVISKPEDLSSVGAFLQDSICPVSSVQYVDTKFSLLVYRFCWEIPPIDLNVHYRVHSHIIFDEVSAVHYTGFSTRNSADHELNFLIFSYQNNQIQLKFSNHCDICLTINTLKCWVYDQGEPWPTSVRPDHN